MPINSKAEVLKVHPAAIALQGFIWMIYDKPDPPITQIGRGESELLAWQNAYFRLEARKQVDKQLIGLFPTSFPAFSPREQAISELVVEEKVRFLQLKRAVDGTPV